MLIFLWCGGLWSLEWCPCHSFIVCFCLPKYLIIIMIILQYKYYIFSISPSKVDHLEHLKMRWLFATFKRKLNCRGSSSSWERIYFCPSFFFFLKQGPGDYFYRRGDVVLTLWPTPKNRKPKFLWKSTRWKQIAPRENNNLAEAHSGGQLDPDACMIYHFLYLLLCVWGCCVQHNDPWLKIELRLWDGSGAILIWSLLLRTLRDHLKSVVAWSATDILDGEKIYFFLK